MMASKSVFGGRGPRFLLLIGAALVTAIGVAASSGVGDTAASSEAAPPGGIPEVGKCSVNSEPCTMPSGCPGISICVNGIFGRCMCQTSGGTVPCSTCDGGGTAVCNSSCQVGPCTRNQSCNPFSCSGAGNQTCTNNVWSPCTGCTGTTLTCTTSCGTTGNNGNCNSSCAVTTCNPPQETCNGIDDDCNGFVDDGLTCNACDNL